MSRHSKRHRKVALPKSYQRRQIIIDYLKNLGSGISKFGASILLSELKIHKIQTLVDNIFYYNDGKIPYEDCLTVMEVTFEDSLKKPKEKKNHVFEEMSFEEISLEYCS